MFKLRYKVQPRTINPEQKLKSNILLIVQPKDR